MTRIYNVWRDRLTEPVWNEGWIRQFRLDIWRQAHGYPPAGMRSNLTEDEAGNIWRRHHDQVRLGNAPRVTDTQADKGRRWLAGTGRQLGAPDLDYTAIDHFTFDDVRLVDDGRYHPITAPVYVARWGDGTRFTYWATPWLTGSDFTYTLEAA